MYGLRVYDESVGRARGRGGRTTVAPVVEGVGQVEVEPGLEGESLGVAHVLAILRYGEVDHDAPADILGALGLD